MEIRATGNAVPSDHWNANRSVSPTDPASAMAKQFAAPVQTSIAVQQAAEAHSIGQVPEAIKNINNMMKALSRSLEFSIDADTDRTIVKVVDKQTGDVIRQIPSEEALDIAKALDKSQGLLIKERA